MRLVVISPERERAEETAVVCALFALGLKRYHVRKPHWALARLEAYLGDFSASLRERLVLHQHHELAESFGIGGLHWRDLNVTSASAARSDDMEVAGVPASSFFTSRSCHALGDLQASLGRYDSVFFGPMLPSVSKPGYAPVEDLSLPLHEMLLNRSAEQRRTSVIALGGVTAAHVDRMRTLGFDGVAVLGAVWAAEDPLEAFRQLRSACGEPVAVAAPAAIA